MLKAPCKGCKDRCVGCHSWCPAYLKFAEENEKLRELRCKANESYYDTGTKRRHTQWLKRQLKK